MQLLSGPESEQQVKKAYALAIFPLLMQLVHTRIRFGAPLTSAFTACRFTFQRRRDTLCACEILFPNCGPLPQISHICAMMQTPDSFGVSRHLCRSGASSASPVHFAAKNLGGNQSTAPPQAGRSLSIPISAPIAKPRSAKTGLFSVVFLPFRFALPHSSRYLSHAPKVPRFTYFG